MMDLFGRRKKQKEEALAVQEQARAEVEAKRKERLAAAQQEQREWEVWLDRKRPAMIQDLADAWAQLMNGRPKNERDWIRDALEDYLHRQWDGPPADWDDWDHDRTVEADDEQDFPAPHRSLFEVTQQRERIRKYGKTTPVIAGYDILEGIERTNAETESLAERIKSMLDIFASSDDTSAAAQALWWAITAERRQLAAQIQATSDIMQNLVGALDGVTMALARPKGRTRRPNPKKTTGRKRRKKPHALNVKARTTAETLDAALGAVKKLDLPPLPPE